jgi:hypothetical protein
MLAQSTIFNSEMRPRSITDSPLGLVVNSFSRGVLIVCVFDWARQAAAKVVNFRPMPGLRGQPPAVLIAAACCSANSISMSKRRAGDAGLAPIPHPGDTEDEEEVRGTLTDHDRLASTGKGQVPGTVLRVRMQNLRCHANTEVILGPGVNFIVGGFWPPRFCQVVSSCQTFPCGASY